MQQPDTASLDWAESQTGYYSAEFTVESEMSVAVCSFNVNNKRVPVQERSIEEKLRNWLNLHRSPKIIAVGLQEIDMTAQSVMFGETDARNYWRLVLSALIGADEDAEGIQQSYLLVASRQLVGLFLCVFVHKSITPVIGLQEVRVSTVAIGKSLGPMRENRKSALFNFGNKGAVGVHLQIGQTGIAFINAHLHPHIDGMRKRRQGVSTILSEMLFEVPATAANFHCYKRYFHSAAHGVDLADSSHEGKHSKESQTFAISPSEHGVLFFFGDLNFRLHHPPSYALQRSVVTNDWTPMFDQYDQLHSELRANAHDEASGWLGFEERHSKATPSYRYVVKKNVLDLPHGILSDDFAEKDADKGRIPGFTDRILWKAQREGSVEAEELIVHSEISFSDHKPVSGLFRLRVPLVDAERRRAVKERLSLSVGVKCQAVALTDLTIDKRAIHFNYRPYGVVQHEEITLHNSSDSVMPVRIHAAQQSHVPKSSTTSTESTISNQNQVRNIAQRFVDIPQQNIVLYPGDTKAITIVCSVHSDMRKFQCDRSLRIGERVCLSQEILIEPFFSGVDRSRSDDSASPACYNVIVSGDFTVSNFGNTLENLLFQSRVPSSSASTHATPDNSEGGAPNSLRFDPTLVGYPIWLLATMLLERVTAKDLEELVQAQAPLKTIADAERNLIERIDAIALSEESWELDADLEAATWQSIYNTMLLFLSHLHDPVAPFAQYESITSRSKGDFTVIDSIVDRFSPTHKSTFVFVVSFIRRLLDTAYDLAREGYAAIRERILHQFAASLIRKPTKGDPFDRHEDDGELHDKRVFLDYFVTMEAEEHYAHFQDFDSPVH